MTTPDDPPGTRTRLLDAAMHVIREKGYAQTTVDDLCRAAGVTKGAFFHHFPSKEDAAVAAAGHFAAMAERLFESAPFAGSADPLARLLGYIDFRIAILAGPVARFTCLLGTLTQEVHQSHPAIRAAADEHLTRHVTWLTGLIADAKREHAPAAAWDPNAVALHTAALVQGALVLAKARQGPDVAVVCLEDLRRYLEMLLRAPATERAAAR